MDFKQPGSEPGLPKKINWLNIVLAGLAPGLALLCYLLFLTGDYFLPVKSPLWLAGAVLLLVVVIAYKIGRSRGFTLAGLRGWLVANGPVLILVVALLGGGLLRYQALKTRPITSASPDPAAVQAFATEARDIINQSNWQPKSYEQPPLYLYGGAAVVELIFFQQASGGKINSPEQVANQDILDYLTYVNLLLGLVTIVVVYAAGSRWWRSGLAGASAAGLSGLAWLAYQATPNPAPQLLAAALGALAFYAMTFSEPGRRAPLFWAGLLAGLATGAAYGSGLILAPLLWLAAFQTASPTGKEKRLGRNGVTLGGWLLGWTLACPGWILGANRFVEGLAAIKPAPEAALNGYFKQFFGYDLGLLAVVFLAFAYAVVRRTTWGRFWPLLAFPVLYFIVLNLTGPLNVTRLALVVPWLALAVAGPFAETAVWLQERLPLRFRQATWSGAALTFLGLALVVAVSILGRRFFA
ncbi:MAG: hypothetical protein J0I20_09425 [Chloroflexi bacterium]|nr:hypothetical protein [Chloroflexota bacterium]OJV94669.1 MAG: hypothetical protein BGO39_23390 [Chloroflexi bacterium 54-19]